MEILERLKKHYARRRSLSSLRGGLWKSTTRCTTRCTSGGEHLLSDTAKWTFEKPLPPAVTSAAGAACTRQRRRLPALIYRLLLVESGCAARAISRQARRFTGPQYTMLITRGYLQARPSHRGADRARNLRVTSAFITAEITPASGARAADETHQSARFAQHLLSVTAAGRRRIEKLVPELRHHQ